LGESSRRTDDQNGSRHRTPQELAHVDQSILMWNSDADRRRCEAETERPAKPFLIFCNMTPLIMENATLKNAQA
jgi:hypothetical protein